MNRRKYTKYTYTARRFREHLVIFPGSARTLVSFPSIPILSSFPHSLSHRSKHAVPCWCQGQHMLCHAGANLLEVNTCSGPYPYYTFYKLKVIQIERERGGIDKHRDDLFFWSSCPCDWVKTTFVEKLGEKGFRRGECMFCSASFLTNNLSLRALELVNVDLHTM